MPIHNRTDSQGHYYQWGDHGHKYYYHDSHSKQKAYQQALTQARAIYYHGYKEK
jgi:hypothetical protein